jgi:hypothetical protein
MGRGDRGVDSAGKPGGSHYAGAAFAGDRLHMIGRGALVCLLASAAFVGGEDRPVREHTVAVEVR